MSHNNIELKMSKTERFFKRLPHTTFFDPKFIGNALDKKLIENVKKNDLEGVEKSLLNGANINAKDSSGKTPLMLACEREYFLVANFLVQQGSRLYSRDLNNRTPLHYAAMVGSDLKLISLILSKIPNKKQLKVINMEDKFGNTALILAVKNKNYYVTNHLVRMGANKLITNKFGEDVFTIARENKYTHILQLLYKYN